ncbi:MAG: trypsin-like peptidase domain-containing protein [Planctomycetes bacterium]|nr:trypsin-like peptidase domain-containing protein [Planctomycetota bacterium]
MKRIIITVLTVILTGGFALGLLGACPVSGLRGVRDTEVVIVDFDKKPPQHPNPYYQEYEKMLYPTVRISTPTGAGSGVIFTTKDTKNTKATVYILSAAHVVGNESDVRCEIWSDAGYTIQDARVVITDTVKDLALLQLRNANSELRIYKTTLAHRDYTPYLFSPVWAVGCSLGLPPRPSFGHITAIPPRTGEIRNPHWEISAPILPGNSGGPVYALVPSYDDSHAASRGGNARTYEVIGIAVWVKIYQGQLITTMAGIVPVNQIYEFLTSAEILDPVKTANGSNNQTNPNGPND